MVSYTYEMYKWIKTIITLASAVIALVVAGIMIYCLRGKTVRIVFPYIKKHGNYTVAFGFILKNGLIISHYSYVCFIFATVAHIFSNSFFLKTSTQYNPYDFDCFYDNGTEVGQLTPEEAKEERVTCFAWSFGIGEAVGEATGTLALTWIIASTLIYVTLNCSFKFKKFCNNKEKRKLEICGACALVLAGLTIYMVYFGVIIFILFAKSKKWISANVSIVQLCLQITLLVVPLATTILYVIDVTKEPENYSQKVVKANAEEPAELYRIRLKMQKEILTKELTELEKLLKKVEEQDQSDTCRQRRRQSRTGDLDISETHPLLEWQSDQGLEENGTLKEQGQVQEQYKKNRANVEKNIREFEQNLENTTIPEIKGLWNETIEIEEKSFERQKAKLKLDIKKNRLKQDKALGVESEDTSIEEEEREYNNYLDLDQRETECQNKKCNLVDEVAKNLFESKMSLEKEKIRLKKEIRKLGQKEKDDINWEKEWCELDIENSRLEEEKIKLIGANVLREMAELECKMALAREAAFYMTEEEMKKITEAAFYRVMQHQDTELPPHTTDPVLLENLLLRYMLTKHKDRLTYWCTGRASS